MKATFIKSNTQWLSFLDNMTLRIILNTLLVIYMAYIVYQVPLSFLLFLDSTLFKGVILILIFLILCRAPDVAFFLALAYLVSLQVLRNRLDRLEAFVNGEKLTLISVQENGDIIVKSKDDLLEVSKDIVPFLNLEDPNKLLEKKDEEVVIDVTPPEVLNEPVIQETTTNIDSELPLSANEEEMIKELKSLGVIPEELKMISRLLEKTKSTDEISLQYRKFKVELTENGKKKAGTLIVTSGQMPQLQLEEVKETFCGSPVDRTSNYLPQTGCLVPVSGNNLSNMCNAVTTFPNELNAQGLNQQGPLGFSGNLFGAPAF